MIGRRRVLALLLTQAFLLLGSPTPISAAGVATTLELHVTDVIEVGTHPPIEVRLRSASGPVAGAAVEIRLNGRTTARLVTDARGRASTSLARDLASGSYQLHAVFRGTPDYLATVSPRVPVRVKPATFVIQTVPAIPGIPLVRFNGGPPLLTDKDGSIRVAITSVGQRKLELLPPAAEPTRHVTFDRWGDGSRDIVRTIRLPDRTQLTVGLEIAYPVAFRFIDSSGAHVDPGRIGSLVIANDRGDVLQPLATESRWLSSNRIVRGDRGLMSVPTEYRIQEVSVSGSNVVDRGRLHFTPDGELSTWVVPLLLYRLTISGQDALFGYPIGTSVQLAFADGTTASVPLDPQGSATISALPRGNYRAVVERPPGVPLSTPIVLSRDQTVRVPVFSFLDVAILVGAGLGLAIVLLLVGGRPVANRGRQAARGAARALAVLRVPLIVRLVARALLLIPLRTLRAVRRELGVAPRPVPALATAGAVGSLFIDSEVPRGFGPVPEWVPHRHCPSCTNRVRPRARVCWFCGRRLRTK